MITVFSFGYARAVRPAHSLQRASAALLFLQFTT
jgi:hypothetical protein